MKNKNLLIILSWVILLLTWCSKINNNTWNQNLTPSDNETSIEQDNIASTETQENNINEKNIGYENKQYNFSLSIPVWRVLKENEWNFETLLYAPQNDNIRENIWISVQTPQIETSLEDYYNNTINWLWTIISDDDIEINWIKWKNIIYTTESWNIKIKAQQTFMIYWNIVYIIQYTATEDTFQSYINDVNQVRDSFKVLD
jgi:hypothetical protein